MAVTVEDLRGLTLVIAMHTDRNPRPTEWRHVFNTFVNRHAPSVGQHCRHLVLSDGGAPTAAQRNELHIDHWGGKPDRVAVFSSALAARVITPLHRGIAKAFVRLNPALRFFDSDQLDEALSYLEVESEAERVWAALRNCSAQLPPNRTFAELVQHSSRPGNTQRAI